MLDTLDTVDNATITNPDEANRLIGYLGAVSGALEIAAEGTVSSPVHSRLSGAASVLRIAIEHLRFETGARKERP